MMFCLSFSNTASAIDIYYKDAVVPTDTKPLIENGRTLVPLSAIAKSI